MNVLTVIYLDKRGWLIFLKHESSCACACIAVSLCSIVYCITKKRDDVTDLLHRREHDHEHESIIYGDTRGVAPVVDVLAASCSVTCWSLDIEIVLLPL